MPPMRTRRQCGHSVSADTADVLLVGMVDRSACDNIALRDITGIPKWQKHGKHVHYRFMGKLV